jgi:hypothetical protein
MALRNQPYFPLYVQDYLTDEKLNMCSWKTQGIYVKIMCVLHKQDQYGRILFKQNSKQIESNVKYFADYLVRQIPCQLEDMIFALGELIEYDVLQLTDAELSQRRMVKDGDISDKRAEAGKTGGGNPNLFKQKSKQTPKQNPKQITEYEYENEYEDESISKDVVKEEEEKSDFEQFWDIYDKKVDRIKCERKWKNMTKKDRSDALTATPVYVKTTPDRKYRKNPLTYLNSKTWNDEIIGGNNDTDRGATPNRRNDKDFANQLAAVALEVEYEHLDKGRISEDEFRRRTGIEPLPRSYRHTAASG